MPEDVARRVGESLRDAGEAVAVVETVTGGLVGARLSAVPGASDYFDRAYVPYDYDALREVVGVPRETLDEHGAVSAPTTRALARRARDHADSAWGVSTTGVAGPDGGSPATPVGTAFVGVAYAGEWGTDSSEAWVTRHEFDGDRGTVREATARAALEAVRRRVETLDRTREGGT